MLTKNYQKSPRVLKLLWAQAFVYGRTDGQADRYIDRQGSGDTNGSK